MKMSPSISELAKAFVQFKSQHPKVIMDASVEIETKRGGKFSYDYASLSEIKDKVDEYLIQNGLSVMQIPDEQNTLVTILMHTSGEFIESTMNLNDIREIQDGIYLNSGPKEYGSILSYARRYSYAAILNITADASSGKGSNQTTGSADDKKKDEGRKWLNRNTTEWTMIIGHICKSKDPKVIDEFLDSNNMRINSGNRQELLQIQRDYVPDDQIKQLTTYVKNEIYHAKKVDDLTKIYNRFPLLQSNSEFTDMLTQKKVVLSPDSAKNNTKTPASVAA